VSRLTVRVRLFLGIHAGLAAALCLLGVLVLTRPPHGDPSSEFIGAISWSTAILAGAALIGGGVGGARRIGAAFPVIFGDAMVILIGVQLLISQFNERAVLPASARPDSSRLVWPPLASSRCWRR
jgi:hypothetical protein